MFPNMSKISSGGEATPKSAAHGFPPDYVLKITPNSPLCKILFVELFQNISFHMCLVKKNPKNALATDVSDEGWQAREEKCGV